MNSAKFDALDMVNVPERQRLVPDVESEYVNLGTDLCEK